MAGPGSYFTHYSSSFPFPAKVNVIFANQIPLETFFLKPIHLGINSPLLDSISRHVIIKKLLVLCNTLISTITNLTVINNTSHLQIFKASPFVGLILLTDYPRFTIAAATNEYLKAFNKKESAILETGFFEIFEHSDNGDEINSFSTLRSLLSSALKDGKPAKLDNFYCTLKKDDGFQFERTHVDVEITPVLNESDLPVSIIVSFKETENKTVSNNLDRNNSQDYRSIVENSLIAFFLTKPDGTILEANKAACDLFGYSLEELRQIGREGIIDHSEAHIIEKIKERRETGKVKATLTGIKKNGEKFPIEVSSFIFADVNGEERTSTSIIDITKRKNAENALLKSEYHLQEAQKLAKMGSWNFDFEADKLSWTDGLYDVFGANKETFLETHGSFVNLVAAEDRALVMETSRRSQLTGEPFNIEYRITTPGGENRIIEEFGYSEKKANGDIVRLFGTAQDITERKQVEQVLKLSEKKYKTLFKENPLPMFIWDFETLNIIDCNEEALLKYGYTREECLQLNIRDMSPKEDISLVDAATKSEASYRQINKNIWRHLKKNGQLIQMEITAHLMDYGGRRVSLALLNDVTEKLETQKAVLLSNERFNYVNLVTNDAIYDWDVVNDSFTWGESFNRIFNHPPQADNFTLASWIKLMHPDDVEPDKKSWELFLADKNRFKWEHEFRFKRGDNSYAFVEEIGYLVRDENGKPKRMIGVLRDQTQRKKQEQQFKLLKSVITNTNDAVLITEAEPFDEPGPRIVYVNEAFTRMTGYTADEVIGKSPRLLQGPKSDRKELARLAKAMRNWESCEVTTVNYKKNGEAFWINFSISPVADEKGWFTHWISIERDVTQRKNEEQQKLLLTEISRLFNQPVSLSETLSQVLQFIVATGNYCMAEAWMIDTDKKNMNLLSKHVAGDKIELFYAGNPDIRNFAIGEGLPGIVGETQSIHQWNVNEENEYFLRKNEAVKAGIKKITGIPLLYNETIIGSLLLGSSSIENMQNDFIFQSHDFSVHLGAEIKRKRLEQELNQVFDYSQDIICIVNFNGYFKKINPVACTLLGYTEEELLNMPYRDFVHPDDLNVTTKELETLRSGEPTHYFENRYITKSGKTIWFAWSSTSSPKEKLIFAVAKDITEKKNLEVLLNKANRLAAIGSWEIDVTNGTVYWSDITKEIREVDTDFVPDLSMGISYFKEGESRETISNLVKECIEKGTPWDEELQIITHKGNLKWVRTIGEAEMANGRCIRVYGSFQDIDERKKAAIKLAESENRFRTILEAEPECIKLLGPDGELLMMNPAGLAMIEADNEAQVLGKSVLGIILPEQSAAFSALTKNVFKGESGKLVFEIEGLKGTRRWMETHAVPMKNEQGDIISLLGITRDITERKKAEESVRHSEEKNRLIMNSALDAIICIDVNGNVIFWNPQAEKIFGWLQNEIMGQKLSDYIIPVNLRTRHDNGMNHYMKTGEAKLINSIVELSAINKKGDIFPVELTVIPIKQGVEEFFCAFIRDITERKKAEVSILQSNERFEKVTQATNDAIWDWDIVNDNLYRGNGFNTLFGYDVNKNIQAENFWQDKFHSEDLSLIKESLQKVIEDPTATHWQQEYRITKNAGKTATVIDRGIIIRSHTGKAIRMVGAMTDITYRKEYEDSLKQLNESLEQHAQELAASNKELEQFAYVASHDLQEPLRMVTSFLSQLEKKYGDTIDDKGKQYIYFAVDGAKRMRQIILDLLEFSRVGRLENEAEQVNINELVTDVISLYTIQIQESNASIEVENLPVINTHKTPLSQVFQNLIGNALKYRHNEKAPLIKISCNETPGYWMFSIKDNGIGIDKEYFEKIFIIFQRLHNKEQYTGTGIGLAVVKKIINNLDGKIWVESEEGKGTVFYFTLPK